MDQAWKSINGFIVSFTSGFDQWNIWFYTEIKKRHTHKKNKTKQKQNKKKQKKRKSHSWRPSITVEKKYIPLLNSNR